jgi:uncharacterized membrane protein
MHGEVLVLRLLHILSATFWLGSGLFTTFFLVPALASSPASMGQAMNGLQQRRFFLVLPTVAVITILSGMRLLSIDSAGFAPDYFTSGTGRAYAISAVAAIIAFLLSLVVSRPAAVRAGAIAASLGASPQPGEHERLTAELNRVRRRGTNATLWSVVLGIIAASGMAVARYM